MSGRSNAAPSGPWRNEPLSAQAGAQELAQDYVARGQEVDRLQRKLEQQVGELAPDDCKDPRVWRSCASGCATTTSTPHFG